MIDDSWGRSPWAQAGEQLVSSAVLAGVGIAISVSVVQAIPPLRRLFADIGSGDGPAMMGNGGTAVAARTGGSLAGATMIVLAVVLLALG